MKPPQKRTIKQSEWKKLRKQVLERDGLMCYLCGYPIAHPDDYEPDHMIPFSDGGADTLDNLRAAHRGCNRSRRADKNRTPLLDRRRAGGVACVYERLDPLWQRILADLRTGQAYIDATVRRDIQMRWYDNSQPPYSIHYRTLDSLAHDGYVMPTKRAGSWIISPQGLAAFEPDEPPYRRW
jgi:hypothetical protein